MFIIKSMSVKMQIKNMCLDLLKEPTLKQEVSSYFEPLIQLLLKELYPYIYISLMFVLISFLLTLAIFVLLLSRRKTIV